MAAILLPRILGEPVSGASSLLHGGLFACQFPPLQSGVMIIPPLRAVGRIL